jgi:hypothetical protein
MSIHMHDRDLDIGQNPKTYPRAPRPYNTVLTQQHKSQPSPTSQHPNIPENTTSHITLRTCPHSDSGTFDRRPTILSMPSAQTDKPTPTPRPHPPNQATKLRFSGRQGTIETQHFSRKCRETLAHKPRVCDILPAQRKRSSVGRPWRRLG